jgi:hypothetical protein
MSASDPEDEEEQADLPLSPEEAAIYANLSEADLREIDAVILEDCVRYGRKIARVVGRTFMHAKFKDRDIPVSCFAQRVVELVNQGKLLAEGNLNYMRYSEVRLPPVTGGTGAKGGGA